jgi:mannose-6-phosphate isomerase-like protein (cupin superfamily)
MSKSFYEIIEFPLSDTQNGSLTMFQEGSGPKDKMPFAIKKVLTITGMKSDDARGAHTHHRTRQILLAVTGGCTVDLDNGEEKESVVLEKPNQGLLLNPYVWHVMRNFKPDTTLLVLADTLYDEAEYIRDYDEFQKYARENKK